MPTYTVVALLDHDTEPSAFLIAGVIEGDHKMVDTDPGTIDGRFQRYATSVHAASSDAAEHAARGEYDAENERDHE